MAVVRTIGEESIKRLGRLLRAGERDANLHRPQKSGRAIPAETLRTVSFRNDSGEEIPPFAVMRVTGSVVRVTRLVLTVGKPSSAFARLYLVNGISRVDDGAYGEGTWLSTAEYVLYNSSSGTPAYGESWGPKNGQWTLEKYRYGFTILGGNAGSGSTARTCAIQREVDAFLGKTDSTHALDATGTVSIYDGNEVDTTDNMASVKNLFGEVEADRWVDISWRGGKWYLTAARCTE